MRLFTFFFLFLFTASFVSANQRLALVVGIDLYENVPVLQKAVNDARAVRNALNSLDFEVTSVFDANRRDLNKAISDVSSAAGPGDEVVFYFAGHGIEVDGRNFLLPADVPSAQPGDEAFLKSESIPVDQIISALQDSGARVSVLILDACRNNPFPSDGTRSVGGQRGLARIDPPQGTFVIFSAGAGQTALDQTV